VKWQQSAEREVTERDRVDGGVYRNRSQHTAAILLLRVPLACSGNDRPYHQTMNENKRMLKMQDIKQRERKQCHQNAGVETARIESAAQKYRGGNCEKWKQWHKVAGGGKCES